MEKLNLPVIKGTIPIAKYLSMDDYLKFVNLNLKYILDKKANNRLKNLQSVNVQFKYREHIKY